MDLVKSYKKPDNGKNRAFLITGNLYIAIFYPIDTPIRPDKIKQENRSYCHLSFRVMEIASPRTRSGAGLAMTSIV